MSKRVLSALISVFFLGLLVYGVFKETTPSEFLGLLINLDAGFYLGYFSLLLLAIGLRAWRYALVLQVPVSFPNLILITSVRNALSDALPARLGELSFFFMLSRLSVPTTVMLSSFGLCLALDLVVLGAIVAFFCLWKLPVWGVFVVLLVCLAAWCVLRADQILDRCSYLLSGSLLQSFLEACARDIESVRGQGRYLLLFFLTLGLRISKYLSLYLLLRAIIRTIPDPVETTIAFIAAEASSSLPASGILGFGLYEKTWETVLSFSETRIPDSLTVAFAVHLVSQVSSYVIGGVGFLIFLASNRIQNEKV